MSSGLETYSTRFRKSPSVVIDDVRIHGRLDPILANFILEKIYDILGVGQNAECICGGSGVEHLVTRMDRTPDSGADWIVTEDFLCRGILFVPGLPCISKNLRNV